MSYRYLLRPLAPATLSWYAERDLVIYGDYEYSERLKDTVRKIEFKDVYLSGHVRVVDMNESEGEVLSFSLKAMKVESWERLAKYAGLLHTAMPWDKDQFLERVTEAIGPIEFDEFVPGA